MIFLTAGILHRPFWDTSCQYNMGLLDFFSRPLGVAIAWAGTVTGAISGFYFYEQGQAVRELSFYVAPAPAQIVRMGESSKLAVTFGGQPVHSDISATQITVWNAGKLSIHKENVLKSVELVTGEQTPILEATLRTNSRDVTGAALDLSRLAKGRVGLSWNILEQNDGVSLQIIFAGSPNTKLTAEGVIEGQSKLIRVFNADSKQPLWRRIFTGLAIVGYGVAIGTMWKADSNDAARGIPITKGMRYARWGVTVCAGLLLGIEILEIWPSHSGPPSVLTAPPQPRLEPVNSD